MAVAEAVLVEIDWNPGKKCVEYLRLCKMQQLCCVERTNDDCVIGGVICVLITGILRRNLSNQQRSWPPVCLHPAQDLFCDLFEQCVVHVSIIPRLPF